MIVVVYKLWRYVRLKYLQVLRANGSEHEVALGVSWGCFVGLAIPTGLQLLTLALSVPLMRFNRVLSVLFIYITSNFFTLPLVYAAQTHVGSWIFRKDVNKEIELLYNSVKDSNWELAQMIMLEVLDCFLLGGFIFGSIAALISYFLTVRGVNRYRCRKQESKHRVHP